MLMESALLPTKHKPGNPRIPLSAARLFHKPDYPLSRVRLFPPNASQMNSHEILMRYEQSLLLKLLILLYIEMGSYVNVYIILSK
jgi:hypothetical protein